MDFYLQSQTLQLLLPEIALVIFAIAIFMLGAFSQNRSAASWLAVAGLLVSALALYRQEVQLGVFSGTEVPGSGPLVVDMFGQVARWGSLVFGLLMVIFSSGRNAVRQTEEYLGSFLLIVAGLMLVATSKELVLIFVGLELISIPTYVMLYLGKSDAFGQEATAKYFYLSILSSALLLYGFSFLYGIAGSTHLADLARVLSEPERLMNRPLAQLALILVFAGLGFRITAVPFHFYAADVYQGTSQANASLLSIAPKLAGFLVLVRLAATSMPTMESLGWKLALVLAVLTMTFGNVLALWQDNIRRMMAYSSIAHGGYMLIGLAVAFAMQLPGQATATAEAGLNGIGTIFFYLLVYAFATIGTFAALAYLGRQGAPIETVDDLAGLNRSHAMTAIAIAVFMFSLTGIPPLAGFWGKLALFTAALNVDSANVLGAGADLRPWFIGLAVVGVLNAAISAAYYLRIVGALFFRSPVGAPHAEGGMGPYAVMLACLFAVIGIGLRPGGLINVSNIAGESAQHGVAVMPIERAEAVGPQKATPSRVAQK